MMKYTLIFICLFFGLVISQDSDTIGLSSSEANLNPDYPLIEITGGVGFAWILQFNATYSPHKHFYIQPRFSSSVVANEVGFSIGFQTHFKENSLLRLGIGYSKGSVSSLDPGGNSSEDDQWESIYLRFGLIQRRTEKFIFNPNINITRFDRKPIISFNFSIGYALFR